MELTPMHWPFELAMFSVLAVCGLLAMLVTSLEIFRCLALVVGDTLIAAWQQLRC